MFFYYQVRRHHHKTESLPKLTCPICHTAGHMQMSILQKYMWVLGPVVPRGKHAIAFCEHCGNYIPKVKWTDEMDNAFQSSKRDLRTPGRLYRGLIVFPLLVALLIGIALLFVRLNRAKQENNQQMISEAIAHPHRGDIFQITHTDGTSTYYTYFKVAGSKGDSVYFNPSTVRTSDVKAWDNIPTEDTAYEPGQIGFSISQSQKVGMFTYATAPVQYGMVWSLYKDGKTYKKY